MNVEYQFEAPKVLVSVKSGGFLINKTKLIFCAGRQNIELVKR